MNITVLLSSAKTWFLGIGAGAKAAVIATGVAVTAGAVTAPIVIFTAQDGDTSEVSENGGYSGDGVELSAEQQAYCDNMLQYMTNNNGKVPEGENREAVLALCYGDSGNASDKPQQQEFSSLQDASIAKWEAEHCSNVRVSDLYVETRCRQARPWDIYEQVGVVKFSDIGGKYGLGVARGACVAIDNNGNEQAVGGPDCVYDERLGGWGSFSTYSEAPDWISQLYNQIHSYHASRKEFVTDTDIGDTPIRLVAGTEHSYEILEPLTFPNELLRTDCERKTYMAPYEDYDKDGNLVKKYEVEQETWVCPALNYTIVED